MSGLLSVIIPVHNSGKYIVTCVKSIQKQLYKNLEIILIDNNSTDESAEICESLSREDERIHCYYQPVLGAAATRNMGIDKANGNFITFVDSDDYLDVEAYQRMMDCIVADNADAVICSYQCVDETGKRLMWYTPKLKRYANKSPVSGEFACNFFLTSRDIEGFGWNKIFRADLLRQSGLRFEENKTAYEDMVVIFKLLSLSQRVSFVDKELYYYRQHLGSLVHLDYAGRRKEYEDSINEIFNCASLLGLEKEARSSVIYRKVLADYSQGIKREFDIKKFMKEFGSILVYQKTEKEKTLLKLLLLYLRKYDKIS